MFGPPDGILMPVFGHLVLILFLFVVVSFKRKLAVDQTSFDIDRLAHTGTEPELSRRWAKNLDNQFQTPLLFYALVGLLFATAQVTNWQIILAWVFLFGRIVHTAVQVGGDNVRLRGFVFAIGFVALIFMWLLFFVQRFEAL